jgi:hypothetical protein
MTLFPTLRYHLIVEVFHRLIKKIYSSANSADKGLIAEVDVLWSYLGLFFHC